MFGISITKRCHHLLAPYIKPGDTVVDATLGNGNDAIFLAAAVGPIGTLYGFDIQHEALVLTKEKLLDDPSPATCKFHLIQDSHHRMDAYVEKSPSAIMFNLGYLPGGKKDVATTSKTTLTAIKKGLTLLAEKGVMSIITYKGHPGAMEEHKQTVDFLTSLPSNKFEVLSILQQNRRKTTPELHLIQKTSA